MGVFREDSSMLKHSFQDELSEKKYSEIKKISIDKKGTTRLFVARGRVDGMGAKSLIDFIGKEININNREIRNIEIFDRFSFLTLPFEKAEVILKKFNENTKGKRPIITKAKKKK